ncbi:lymphocyte cytosolic protein 2-like isoform X2 [Centruroides vittatus]|uniref:lymphocyte cytosolic protein 2-like isoform X2 n=1 Tax=Centruroides vittatus TaxID=120091 RepID=UPI00350F52F7
MQEYVEWRSVRRYFKRQLAKCVNECKSQATQAKKLVGNIKGSIKKEQPTVDDVQDENDFDYWDTDFEEEEEENDEDEQSFDKTNYQTDISNVKTFPVSESENYKLSGSDENFNSNPSVSEKSADSEQYADHFQNIGTTSSPSTSLSNVSQVSSSPSSKPVDKPSMPKPPSTKLAIKNYPRVNIPRSLPIKRPPSQPPPPPIPQPLSPNTLQEDYEIPINPILLVQTSAASPPSLPSADSSNAVLRKSSNASITSITKKEETIQETYEIVEPPEENYEVVNECQWTGSGLPVSCDKTNRPAVPPRIIGSQTSSPPPLPEKPKKLQESLASSAVASNKDKIGTSERPLLPKKSIDESVQNGLSTANSSILTNLLGGFRDSKRSTSGSAPKGTDKSITEAVIATDSQLSRSSTPDRNAAESSPSSSPRNSTSSLEVRKISQVGFSKASPQPVDDAGLNVANRPLPPVPIQALNGYPWFHNIEREVAEERVSNLSEDGVYVVRPSKRAGLSNPFTLTVSHCGKIFHLNIRHRPDGMFSLGREKPREKAFVSVVDLITFHQKEPILLTLRGETVGKTILCTTIEK